MAASEMVFWTGIYTFDFVDCARGHWRRLACVTMVSVEAAAAPPAGGAIHRVDTVFSKVQLPPPPLEGSDIPSLWETS